MMRTVEQGALTPANAIDVMQASIELEEMAHGGSAFNARHCEVCRVMRDALNEWLGAHQVSPDELAEQR